MSVPSRSHTFIILVISPHFFICFYTSFPFRVPLVKLQSKNVENFSSFWWPTDLQLKVNNFFLPCWSFFFYISYSFGAQLIQIAVTVTVDSFCQFLVAKEEMLPIFKDVKLSFDYLHISLIVPFMWHKTMFQFVALLYFRVSKSS